MTDKNAATISDDTVREVVKRKRRERPEQQVQTVPGDNTKYISHSLRMMDWERADLTNVDEVNSRIKQYFQLCADDDMKPSVEGLAVALGTDRKSLWRYSNGMIKFVPQDVCDALKRAYTILNLQMVDYMQNGRINPVSGIFLMKNNMNYSDQTEVIVTPNNPMGSAEGTGQIATKYENLIEIDPEEQ